MADNNVIVQNVDYFQQSRDYGGQLVGIAGILNSAMNFTQNFATIQNATWMPQYAQTNAMIYDLGTRSAAATQTAASRIKKGK